MTMEGFWWELPPPNIEAIEVHRGTKKCIECGQRKGVRLFTGICKICKPCVDGILDRAAKAPKPTPITDKYISNKKKAIIELAYLEGFAENIIYGRCDNPAARIGPNTVVIDSKLLSDNSSPHSILELVYPVFVDKTVPNLANHLIKKRGVNVKRNEGAGGIYGIFLYQTPKKSYRIIGKKQCWNCGKYKEPNEFHRSSSTGDGLSHTCSLCLQRHEFLFRSGYRKRHDGSSIMRYPTPKMTGISNSSGVI